MTTPQQAAKTAGMDDDEAEMYAEALAAHEARPRPGSCHECGTAYADTDGRGSWFGDTFYDGCRGWD